MKKTSPGNSFGSCNCRQPNKFAIKIKGQSRTFAALDVVLFVTRTARPQTVPEALKLLWDQANLYNELDPAEEDDYKAMLFDCFKGNEDPRSLLYR